MIENPKINFFRIENIYNHPDVVNELTSLKHSVADTSAIYCDHLVGNHELSSKAINKMAKFIYLIRDPKQTLSLILEDKSLNYTIDTAYSYYIFRMRRIYEMIKVTNNLFLTWNDLSDANLQSNLSEFLNVDFKFKKLNVVRHVSSSVPSDILIKAEEIYEKYLFNIKKLIGH